MNIRNKKYRYMITGYDNGEPIKPYVIFATISELETHLCNYGDRVRYYQELQISRKTIRKRRTTYRTITVYAIIVI